MLNFLFVGLGGFSGAVCRYLFYLIFKKSSFPHATFMVNVLGCLLIGFLYGMCDVKQIFNTYAKSFVFVGFLGSFTTFSHMSDKKLLQMKNQSKNEKDFLNNLSKLWKVVKENHKYYVIYDKCYCPLVQNNPKSFPESICYCSLGSLKHKFKIAFGRDIKIEMQKTIIKGNKECLFEIKL